MTKVIGLLLAKDEADILPLMLEENKWLDGIVAIDHDSSDKTYEILKSNPLVLDLEKNDSPYNEKYFVEKMMWTAEKHKADWYVSLDADEIYDDGIRKIIANISKEFNTITVTLKYILGMDRANCYKVVENFPRIFRNLGIVELMNNTMGVIHRGKLPIPKEQRIHYHSGISCWHYQIRSREQGFYKYNRCLENDSELKYQPQGYEHLRELALCL